VSHQGVVAAGHMETCRAAAAMLEAGGTAVDAALAGLAAACVAEPVLASLGGGGFLAVRVNEGAHAGRSVVYDFFTQTPKRPQPAAAIDFRPVLADFGPEQQQFHIGWGAIATPGVVRGLFEAHRDLGRMPMRAIVEPAVRLARDGVRIDAMQAYVVGVVAAILQASAASRRLFASPRHPDALIGEGELLRQPELAEVLELLAIEEDDLFYRGEIAQLAAADCRAHGGQLMAEDFRDYRVERRPPLAVDAFGARILLNPPPSTGGILIAFALELAGAIGLAGAGGGYLTRLAEVMAATSRARIAGRFDAGDAGDWAARLLDPGLVRRYRDEILGRPAAMRGTTHISVIDKAGTQAALTVSNGEGSACVVPGTGIMLNNMLGEEDINPAGFLAWPADTRMSSMMAPTLLQSPALGSVALGSGGSNRIRTAIVQVLLNLLVRGMPLAEAVAAPRIHVEGDTLHIEGGFDDAEAAALAVHPGDIRRWPERNIFFGGVHAARQAPGGGGDGAGDERRGGRALVL
jgi:gamma-glutamyltranspeptidase/glutathione hydrolase